MFHSDEFIFYGFRRWQSAGFPYRVFSEEVASITNLTDPFRGPGTSKTSRNKLQQKTEYIILALQAEKTNNKQTKKKKVQFTLYHKCKHACL